MRSFYVNPEKPDLEQEGAERPGKLQKTEFISITILCFWERILKLTLSYRKQ
jgi:hypothetical protein